jgi:hypothetical protein
MPDLVGAARPISSLVDCVGDALGVGRVFTLGLGAGVLGLNRGFT